MAFPDIVKIFQGAYNYKEVGKFLAAEMKNASWNSFLINIAIIYVLTFVIQVTLFNYVYNELFLPTIDPSMASYYPPRTVVTSVVDSVISIIIFLPLFMICIHLIAKLFKGKGKIMNMAYLYSVLSIAFIIPQLIIGSFMTIPLVGCLIGLLLLVFFIYVYYTYYKAIRLVYGIDKTGGIITLIGAAIIAGIVATMITFTRVFITSLS